MHKNIMKDDNNQLALTIKENDLANIILNFLGKKETLIYEQEDINFKLYRNDIEQFYYLLNTKIEKESYSNITHFSVTFFYNDNTKREINEIETLNSFLETRDVIPKKIILSWNIILNFPNTQRIENQEVRVEFNILEKTNSILISIKHTNPVWGTEVLNLFKEHSKSLIDKESQVLVFSKQVIQLFRLENILSTILLLFLPIMLSILYNENNIPFNKKQTEIISILIDSEEKHSISNLETILISDIITKKDTNKEIVSVIKDKKTRAILNLYILEKENKLRDKRMMTFIVISTIAGFILIIYLLLKQNIKYFSEKSFILTTARSEKSYDLYKKSKNKMEYYSFSFIFFSVIIGLLVNALYQFMS